MLGLLISLIVIFISTLLWVKSRPRNFPPGPVTLPIIGNVHNVPLDNFAASIQKLHNKHGPIISLSFLGHNIWDVWIEGYDLIKDVLHDPRFSARTKNQVFECLQFDKGLGFCSGEVAKRKRKLIVQTMRMLGVGKSVFSTGVEEETQAMLEHLESLGYQSIYIQGVLSYVTNNVISKLLFNTSFPYDDEQFLKMHKDITRIFYLLNPTRLIALLPFSISRHLPEMKELIFLNDKFKNIVRESFNRRNPEISSWQEPECMSDHLWTHLGNENEEFPFPPEEIPDVLSDLLMAGQETTTTTLAWACLNILHNPEVQENIYKELKNEFPNKEEIISVSAMPVCPYTMATLNEVQRFTPVTFTTIDHTASLDIDNFHGFSIPKGTRIMPSIILMNRDPKFWKFPNQFNPENFLDENGRFVKSQYLMPFGVGVRACPGENIAKMELFVVFSNLIRRFKVCPSGSGKIPALVPNVGFVAAAPYFEVKLEKREV